IKTFAFLGIAQQIVGASDFLELFFGRLVTRIKIRMQFLRQLAIFLLNVGGRSRRGNAENFVRIPHELLRKLPCSLKATRAKKFAAPADLKRFFPRSQLFAFYYTFTGAELESRTQFPIRRAMLYSGKGPPAIPK